MNFRHGACACLFLGALLSKPFALDPTEPLDPLGRAVAPESGGKSSASDPIRLLCEYSRTIDDQGNSGPARPGEVLITARRNEDGIARIKRENFDKEFSGTISEEEITGQVEYRYRETFIRETMRINRYTGSMVATVSVARNVVLTHFGECRPASEKLF